MITSEETFLFSPKYMEKTKKFIER